MATIRSPFLVVGASLSALAAALHLGCIAFGAPWYGCLAPAKAWPGWLRPDIGIRP